MSGLELVTIPVACHDYLGICADTGYTLAKEGHFPGDAAIRIGVQWRVSVPKLLRYLHGEEANEAAAAETRAKLAALRAIFPDLAESVS